MIVKIEDAKTKWCPYARYKETGTDAAYNRRNVGTGNDNHNPMSCRCIADRCMAWRWSNGDSGSCGLAGIAYSR